MSWANEGLNCVNVIHCYRFTFRGKQKCSLRHLIINMKQLRVTLQVPVITQQLRVTLQVPVITQQLWKSV
jgi:hypothetical protein